MKKEYTNGEITIVWSPRLCMHAGNCMQQLPNVYDTNKSPWIEIKSASTAELINQIESCPSGALSYFFNEK